MRSARTLTARVTESEAKALKAGAEALGISRSGLMAAAATIAYHELGFFEDGRRPPAKSMQSGAQLGFSEEDGRFAPRKEAAHRKRGNQGRPAVFSVSALQFAIAREAAARLQVPLTSFLVGAAMRFLATCKKAQPASAKLASLSLPPEYELRKKAARWG